MSGCLPRVLKADRLVKQQAEVPASTLFQDVTLFDSEHGKMIRHQDVVMGGERIMYIQKHDPERTIDPKTKVVDGTGKTLLPGFVDAHVHLTVSGALPRNFRLANIEHNLHAYLRAGVTSVMDLSVPRSELKKMKAVINDDKLVKPQIFWAGGMLTKSKAHPLPMFKTMIPFPFSLLSNRLVYRVDKGEMDKWIADAQTYDMDMLKLSYDKLPHDAERLSKDELAAAIRRADQRMYRTAVHIGTASEMVDAFESGAFAVSHMPYQDALATDDIQSLKAISEKRPQAMYVTPTVSAWKNIKAILKQRFQVDDMTQKISPEELWRDAEAGVDPAGKEMYQQLLATLDEGEEHWKNNLMLLLKSPVKIAMGTDSPLAGSYPGSSLHEELSTWVSYGMSELEALKAATWNAAHMISKSPDFGVIRPGARGDLVLVEGDPSKDIQVTRSIKAVYINGRELRPIHQSIP